VPSSRRAQGKPGNGVTWLKRKFANSGLVIVDGLGYVSFDKEGNEILFEPAF